MSLPQETNLKVVALSDTHNKHREIQIPECDILIHAGDATALGTEKEMRDFAKWMAAQPAAHKIFVPGNRELAFEKNLPASKTWLTEECSDLILLIDDGVCIDGINIWGSPYTPKYRNWAFLKPRFEAIKWHWDTIPDETDILITHGPPLGILDKTYNSKNEVTGRLGCEALYLRVNALPSVKYHFFGHIHDSHGMISNGKTQFFNVAICNDYNQREFNPTVLEI